MSSRIALRQLFYLLFIALLLHSGAEQATSAESVGALLKTIEEGQGRAVYDAFQIIAQRANDDDQQAVAFAGLAKYLGDSERKLTVPNFRPPQFRNTFGHFSYSELARQAILQLGEPARRGLVDCLQTRPGKPAEQAAEILCTLEIMAQKQKLEAKGGEPRVFDEFERKALEAFLTQEGKTLTPYTLNALVQAGLPTALPELHRRIKIREPVQQRREAISYLGRYDYQPALDDLLTMLRTDPEADFRSRAADALRHSSATERTLPALEASFQSDPEEGVKTSCRNALAEIRYRLEKK